MSTKLEAIANLFSVQPQLNTPEESRESIIGFVNCKYQLSVVNNKYVDLFIREFDNKIFDIKNTKKTNKKLNIKDEVLKVFKDELLEFYRNYAVNYKKELENFSHISVEKDYKKTLDYLEGTKTKVTSCKLNSFKISNQERLIYPNCFARILERTVRTTFGPGVVNYVKSELNKFVATSETKNQISDIWNNYYGQNFLHDNYKSDFTTFIKCVKYSYEGYTSAVNRLILIFNQKLEIPATN